MFGRKKKLEKTVTKESFAKCQIHGIHYPTHLGCPKCK